MSEKNSFSRRNFLVKADKEAGLIEIDELTIVAGIPKTAWEYKLGNRSALEWILDQYKEKKPSDPTIAEKFNTYRFADYKEQVIDLLRRVCTVSVETMKIIGEMESDISIVVQKPSQPKAIQIMPREEYKTDPSPDIEIADKRNESAEEEKIKVFCYGSNMSSKQMLDRCPNAEFNCTAYLPGYKIKFNKRSTKDKGSCKANITTGSESDRVWGAVFEVSIKEFKILKGIEVGYNKEDMVVKRIEDESDIEAKAFIATDSKVLDNNLLPSSEYIRICIEGAVEAKLPDYYIDLLKSLDTKD